MPFAIVFDRQIVLKPVGHTADILGLFGGKRVCVHIGFYPQPGEAAAAFE